LDADNQPILKAKTKNLSNASINRYCAALSAVLTWAVHRRLAPKNWQNPCHSIEQRPEKNEIVRYLSDAERTALLTACKASKWPRLYLLALMGLTTGARRGELEGLRWRDINLERAEASVHQSKNGDRKTLPLTPAVIQELKKFQGPPASLIFASTRRPDVAYNNVPVWTKALKDAGVRNFRFHDLRHSCASALAQDGATLLQIADVLGHRQMSVTKRYSHLATSHKSELINRVLGDIR
jgi:integrase